MTTSQTKQTPALLPAYLVVGEDALKRDTVLKRLHTRLESMGDLSFNFDQLDGSEASGSQIVGACNTLPFASEVRLVQVMQADKLVKVDAEELIAYLSNPASTTVLALVADKLAKNTRLYKAVAAVGKAAIIDCTPLKKKDLPQAVRSMATGMNIVLTESAAHVLIDLVGEDTIHLESELKKLSLAHVGADPVNEAEVRSLVERTSELKPWDFTDALSARDIERCVYCFNRMQSVSCHALLSFCVTRIRELICARALIDRNTPGQLPALLKMPDWRCKNHLRWARGFTTYELQQALISARDAERLMKSGGDERTVFFSWVMGVVLQEA